MNAHTLNGMVVKNHHSFELAIHAFQIMPPVHRTCSASCATWKGCVIISNASNPGEGVLSMDLVLAQLWGFSSFGVKLQVFSTVTWDKFSDGKLYGQIYT